MSENTGTALAVIQPSSLPTIIAADADDILGNLAKKVQAFRQDVSTHAGRAEMRSLAYDIAKALADLDRLGKGLTEGWRKSTAAVNAERRLLEERMRELQEKVRAPLTAWENAEKNRVAGHEAALAAIVEAPDYGQTETARELRQRYDYLRDYPIRNWQEFQQRADEALTAEIVRTERLLAAAVKAEADAWELNLFRAKQAEQDRLAAIQEQERRERQIAAEAAERATREAEERADAEAKRRAALVEAERLAAERETREAVELAKRAQEAAAQAERDRAAAVAKAEQDRVDAERNEASCRAEAALDAERAQRAAVEAAEQAERKRAANAKAAEEAETARRTADKQHRAEFNREALADLVAAGVSDAHARTVIAAIAKGAVRHVEMRY
jgi:hypothetical protein